MRGFVVAAAFLLSACGQSSDGSSDPDDQALPDGAIVGVGEDWTFNANPADNAVSLYVEDGTEASGPWAPPRFSGEGYVMDAGGIRATFKEEACQLNGAPYPMRATIEADGATYAGCAAVRWDHQLLALMPQIDACIAQSPETRWVSYAGNLPDDVTLVRLNAGDVMIDCRVENNVAAITPRNETLFMPTEHAAIFVRGPGANPGGECYAAPEVRAENTELLGWMIDPMGC